MFWTRFLSSVTILITTMVVVILGGNILFAAMLIISLIGMMELYRIVKMNKALPGIMGYAAGISFYLLLLFGQQQYEMLIFAIFLILIMSIYVFRFPMYKIDQIAISYFSLFYVAVMLSYIYQVRMLEHGDLIVWLIFIGAWGSDTCAYCVGVLIGKHKLAPLLSPKKSVEGSIGGVVGASLIAFIFASVLRGQVSDVSHLQLIFALIGAASSVISQIADLAASAIKRNYDVKDYGTLIPGHGGIMDRFDSIIFTAPIVYYLVVLLK